MTLDELIAALVVLRVSDEIGTLLVYMAHPDAGWSSEEVVGAELSSEFELKEGFVRTPHVKLRDSMCLNHHV